MTTAHKPTYNPAVGYEDRGGSLRGPASRAVSAKDQPGHKNLKYRQEGQSAPSDIRAKDLKAELEERERKHRERDDEDNEEVEEPRKRIEPNKKDKAEFNPLDKDDSDSSDDSSSDDNR